jgi:hypothetical protein
MSQNLLESKELVTHNIKVERIKKKLTELDLRALGLDADFSLFDCLNQPQGYL